ncbi:nucleotidyltransferase domain-containing protein [Candidatus Micrarchaeota archaeon]|nr:nucleotidyltransferase domain-containing protein [Candidatus Micrarchaeota archaeon]
MRFHNVLSEVAGSRSKARVLETLLNVPGVRYTGRQLALKARVSQSQTNKALEKLNQYGMVRAIRAGSAVVWSANLQHVVIKWLLPLSSAERQIPALIGRELDEEIGLRGKVDRIVLFGSVARAQERPTSDVDILVIVSHHRHKAAVHEKVLDVSSRLLEVLGNPLMPVVYTREEAREKKGSELMRNISKDGIVIYDGEFL